MCFPLVLFDYKPYVTGPLEKERLSAYYILQTPKHVIMQSRMQFSVPGQFSMRIKMIAEYKHTFPLQHFLLTTSSYAMESSSCCYDDTPCIGDGI